MWCWDFEYVPSLHFAVAPAGSLPPAAAGATVAAAAAGPEAVDLAAALAAVVAAEDDPDMAPEADVGGVADAPAGETGVSGAAGTAALPGDAAGVFCTPPCPLQAPRPLAADVVPSLHVVEPAGAAAAGAAGATGAGATAVLAAVAGDFGVFC